MGVKKIGIAIATLIIIGAAVTYITGGFLGSAIDWIWSFFQDMFTDML